MIANPLVTLLLHDMRLQARYGIYAAYGFVILVYVAVLVGAGSALPPWVGAVVIFSDPAGLGYIFLGGLLMLEKSERVRDLLSVSPVSVEAYVAAKVITLTVLALAACTVLAVAMHGEVNLVLLLAAVALTSVQYIGIGFPVGLRFRTVTAYLFGAGTLLALPVTPGLMALMDPMPAWLIIIPAVSQLRLMLVATGAAQAMAIEIAAMLLVCGVAAAGGWWLAVRAMRRELGR